MTQPRIDDKPDAPKSKTIAKKPSAGLVTLVELLAIIEKLLTCNRTLYDLVVYVKVGPDGVEYGIHRGLLCYQSAYFRSCFHGPFTEALAGTVTLDDEDPKIFKRFNAWLYTGNLLYDEETIEKIDYDQLFETYVFAEKRLIPNLQNACIDAVIHKDMGDEWAPRQEDVTYLWENTSHKSPMRRLLVDEFVSHVNMPDYLETEEDIEPLSKDFLAALVHVFYKAKIYKGLRENHDFWGKRCRYHIHEDGTPKCR